MNKYSFPNSQPLKIEEQKDDEGGTSLFHRRLAQRKLKCPQEEEAFMLRRLIVIAAVPKQLNARKDLAAHHEELNHDLQRQHKVDHITGLLLIYPTCMLHIIESSNDVLVSYLKDMRERTESILVEAKVLLMSHEPPCRLFQQWSYKVLTMQASRLAEEFEEKPTESLVGTVLSMLMRLCSHPEIAKETLPGAVLDEVPELTVPEEVLDQLLGRNELMSPRQYLQFYYSPLNISMDSV